MSPIIYVCPALRTAAAEPRGAFLPIRAAPSFRAHVDSWTPDGARLLILQEKNSWCEVCAHGGHGWVPKTDIMLLY